MPGPHILRRTRAVAALPVRFDASEQRHDERQAALEAQVREVRDHLEALRSALAELRGVADAGLRAEQERLEVERDRLATERERLLAETESAALVGRLLQRAEARLDALEQGGA